MESAISFNLGRGEQSDCSNTVLWFVSDGDTRFAIRAVTARDIVNGKCVGLAPSRWYQSIAPSLPVIELGDVSSTFSFAYAIVYGECDISLRSLTEYVLEQRKKLEETVDSREILAIDRKICQLMRMV